MRLDCPSGVPGIILTFHTFGEYLDLHPHVHALVADGLVLRPPDEPDTVRTQITDSLGSSNKFYRLH